MRNAETVIADYFEGLERHSSAGVSFRPDCMRRDNAVQVSLGCGEQVDGKGVAPNGLYIHTSVVRERRILITDAERAVVLAVAIIDNPGIGGANVGATGIPASQLVPSTYMVPQLIKIDSGLISRVEAMEKWMPFGYASAWGR